ncbi:MAG TPA: ABC transporter, partial [Erysipelotrichaceae bacterium]|nr:ABC transporter [Erysipelotrichaceae bacterium]
MEHIIDIEHLQKHFGDLNVLHDVDFRVEKGEVVTIIGSSGSGKSTLLRCINLLEIPDGGQIRFKGNNILDSKVDKKDYRSKVLMVFQSFNLFNNLSVLENCVIGQTKVLKRSKEEARKVAMERLKQVGMQDFANADSTRLSGGQKQRVA